MNDETITLALAYDEAQWMRSQVRQALRKNYRTDRNMRRLRGTAYDPSRYERRKAFLESLYRRLGGDPAQISNYER